MRSALRLLALMLVVGLAAGVGSAQAAIIGDPDFTLLPHTKAQVGMGTAVTMTLVWLPPQFSPPTGTDKQEVTYTDLAGGSPRPSRSAPRPATAPLLLSDGHEYSIRVAACTTATCTPGVGTTEKTGTTRIDATPPSGTVQINGGAAATNNRTSLSTSPRPTPLSRAFRARRAASPRRPSTSTPTGPSPARSSSTIPTPTSAGAPPTSTPRPRPPSPPATAPRRSGSCSATAPARTPGPARASSA